MRSVATTLHAIPPNTFSSLLFVNECLLDQQRISALRNAIRSVVRPGDVVVDAGTGSGILALFAAEAGAKKVYAVDVDQTVLTLARRSISSSAFAHIIEVVDADLLTFTTPAPVDVVIMEMLDTGLIAELQAPALNAMRHHNVIGESTRVVPERAKCIVELVEYDFDFYGFAMPLIVQARNSGANHRIQKVLSEVTIYRDIEFSNRILTTVDDSLVVAVASDGVFNAVRLRTQTFMHGDNSVWETTDMNMPVIIPVGPLNVKCRDRISLAIRYVMGSGFANLDIRASQYCLT